MEGRGQNKITRGERAKQDWEEGTLARIRRGGRAKWGEGRGKGRGHNGQGLKKEPPVTPRRPLLAPGILREPPGEGRPRAPSP